MSARPVRQVAQGGRFGGYSLFVKDKKLHFAYNFCGLEEHKVASEMEVPSGKAVLKVEFKKKAKDAKLPPLEQLARTATGTAINRGYTRL